MIADRNKVYWLDRVDRKFAILLKAENKLSSQQKKLEQVKGASPLVEVMHSLKEELHQIF
ncbi:ISL3 family transposase, partial [Planktothrix sp. FACHB-1355]|nr:ISL3 family transposase [Planktothrix sp. FACHB-1355]